MTPDQCEAYDALHAALERVVRLDDTEVDGDVTVESAPEARMVMQYAVVAAVRSPELVEAEATHYYRVSRDDRAQPLPVHVVYGLLGVGRDGLLP